MGITIRETMMRIVYPSIWIACNELWCMRCLCRTGQAQQFWIWTHDENTELANQHCYLEWDVHWVCVILGVWNNECTMKEWKAPKIWFTFPSGGSRISRRGRRGPCRGGGAWTPEAVMFRNVCMLKRKNLKSRQLEYRSLKKSINYIRRAGIYIFTVNIYLLYKNLILCCCLD